MKLRFALFAAVLVGIAALFPVASSAQTSENVFKYKKWSVNLVALDDGTILCNATVNSGNSDFTLWSRPGMGVELQFYSSAWNFGNDAADIKVEIDRRGVWNMRNASLEGHAVYFSLTSSDSSAKFLREVMAGNVLKLGNSKGKLIHSYSLAGSHASINKLVECVQVLRSASGGQSENPFK